MTPIEKQKAIQKLKDFFEGIEEADIAWFEVSVKFTDGSRISVSSPDE